MVLHFEVLSLNKLFFALKSQTTVLDLDTELKWCAFESSWSRKEYRDNFRIHTTIQVYEKWCINCWLN
jgi:hypothetical protein